MPRAKWIRRLESIQYETMEWRAALGDRFRKADTFATRDLLETRMLELDQLWHEIEKSVSYLESWR